MKTKDAIKAALTSTQGMLRTYLSDLSDADLLVRPVPNANHIAWQLGHLINSEKQMLQSFFPAAGYAEIPVAVVEKDTKAAAGQDTGFRTKAEYLDLFAKIRDATIAAVDNMADADFDKPTTGPMAEWAPTLGSLLILNANHTLMHAGQFTVVRRKLGKPVLF